MDNGNIGGIGIPKSQTPEPIVTIFGAGDYVGDVIPSAKIQTDRPSGGVLANEWMSHSCGFEFLVFLWPKFL